MSSYEGHVTDKVTPTTSSIVDDACEVFKFSHVLNYWELREIAEREHSQSVKNELLYILDGSKTWIRYDVFKSTRKTLRAKFALNCILFISYVLADALGIIDILRIYDDSYDKW